MRKLWLYITLLVAPMIISVLYYDIADRPIPRTKLIEHDGNIIAVSPIRPGKLIWFGTDGEGYHLFFESLSAYRITLLCVIGIAVITMLLATLCGAFLAYRKGHVDKVTDAWLTSYYFVPQAVFGYILLSPVLSPFDAALAYSLQTRIIYNMVVLAVVLLPTTTMLIRDEIRRALDHEYIEAAATLGSGRIRQLYVHVWPNIRERYLIIFIRNIYQTLMVMSHIAFLKIFFGGTNICAGLDCTKPLAISELTTMIGHYMHDIYFTWWEFIVPLLFIVYILIVCQLIADEMEVKFRE